MVPERIFSENLFAHFFLSDDESVRELVANLYRLFIRTPGANEATPQEILYHSFQLYLEHRVSSIFLIAKIARKVFGLTDRYLEFHTK